MRQTVSALSKSLSAVLLICAMVTSPMLAQANPVAVTLLNPGVLTGLEPNRVAVLDPSISTGDGDFVKYLLLRIDPPADAASGFVRWISTDAEAVTSFGGEFYTASNCTASQCDLGRRVAALAPTGIPGEVALSWTFLTSNYYAVKVFGTSTDATALLEAEFVTRVPLPSVLSLLGLGLCGLSLAGRRGRA